MWMCRLGLLLTDILLMPHDLPSAVVVKRHVVRNADGVSTQLPLLTLAAPAALPTPVVLLDVLRLFRQVHLLLHIPSAFTAFLHAAGAFLPLCDMLVEMVREVAVEQSADSGNELKHLIGALIIACKTHGGALAQIEGALFGVAAAAAGAAKGASKDAPAAPAPAAAGGGNPAAVEHIRTILRDHIDDGLRLFLNELVMLLSRGDKHVFAERVGEGNSVVYMLQHGLMAMPH